MQVNNVFYHVFTFFFFIVTLTFLVPKTLQHARQTHVRDGEVWSLSLSVCSQSERRAGERRKKMELQSWSTAEKEGVGGGLKEVEIFLRVEGMQSRSNNTFPMWSPGSSMGHTGEQCSSLCVTYQAAIW